LSSAENVAEHCGARDTATHMKNPWLDIPAADYIGHMSSPDVDQYQVLNRLLRDALWSTRPHCVLVLGCSTGNGFEHVDPAVTSRVVGIDINPAYLQRLAERFPDPPFMLDVRCADLAEYRFDPETFDLVHAALVFEYVEWSRLLPRVAAGLKPTGALNVVLQLPSPEYPAVTPTGFTSLRSLESVFRFVEPAVLVEHAMALGLGLASRRTERLRSEKAFEVCRFSKGTV
jgi:SAM-dependent methyltransferase